MSRNPRVEVHFKEVDWDDTLKEHFEERCGALADEFHEAVNFELTLRGQGEKVEASCVVKGSRTHLSAHANGCENARKAGDDALMKMERELRKEHDKRIFNARRKEQKQSDRQRSD